MAITASIKASSSVSEALTNGSASATLTGGPALSINLTSGTGAGQVDKYWELKGVTIAAGNSVTYTLSSLTDGLNRAVAFARVKELLIDLTDSSNVAGDIVNVGNATSNPWTALMGGTTPTYIVRAAGFDHKCAPGATAFAVASGSSDQLKIANPGSNAIKMNIYIKGASA